MATARDLDGRVFLITGATAGIGLATARALAARGAELLLACRSASKAAPIVEELRRAAGHDRVELVTMDLADLPSVRAAGERVLARPGPLHVLINNAGIGGIRGVTADGFELTFCTNHLGHFLLTTMLLPKLRASAPARIVHVSSGGHYWARGIDWSRVRGKTSFTGMPEYSLSKLANVLFSNELARRLEGTGVTSNALHPGAVASDIWKRLPGPVKRVALSFMISNEEGAKTTLHCATAPELEQVSGRYFDDCREKTASRPARDRELAAELWRRSEIWVRG